MTFEPLLQTTMIVIGFAAIYLIMVLRKTLHGEIDLYDLIMLSMVAIVPLAFVIFPDITAELSQITGVFFPFVLMFGALFLVVFVFMHRMTARLHKLERQNAVLTQELALLSISVDQRRV